MIQQKLFPITTIANIAEEITFNPNSFCIRPDGNCVECKLTKEECCPCNHCPKREGYWTPSETEEGKNVEVKCHGPCRIFKHWKKIFPFILSDVKK